MEVFCLGGHARPNPSPFPFEDLFKYPADYGK